MLDFHLQLFGVIGHHELLILLFFEGNVIFLIVTDQYFNQVA